MKLRAIELKMENFKKKFFILHLSCSLIIVFTISLICQYIWFPQPFLILDGTWVAISIIAFVDIILGPLLTLLFITNSKTKMARNVDISIIILLQISALSYGLIQIEKERVIAIVHFNGAFHSVAKKELSKSDLHLLESGSLPQYNGIYYAASVDSGKIMQKHPIYTPKGYQPLSKENLVVNKFLFKNLPLDLQLKYNDTNIFKVLVGKQRAANIVITNDLKIIDIKLIPKQGNIRV